LNDKFIYIQKVVDIFKFKFKHQVQVQPVLLTPKRCQRLVFEFEFDA